MIVLHEPLTEQEYDRLSELGAAVVGATENLARYIEELARTRRPRTRVAILAGVLAVILGLTAEDMNPRVHESIMHIGSYRARILCGENPDITIEQIHTHTAQA